MERNVLARPSFGGAREDSERLDLVEDDRGNFPGSAAMAAFPFSLDFGFGIPTSV